MARTKESGYKNQMYILLALRNFGPLYGQEIVDKTGLKREEVWRNLRVLLRKQIIKGEKAGRKKYYRTIVGEKALAYIISILSKGGLQRILKESKGAQRQMIKTVKSMLTAAKEAEKYEDEIIELAAPREPPYGEMLPYAKNWKKLKEEKPRLKTRLMVHLPKHYKKEIRESLTYPRKLETKEVTTPSGKRFTIRKMTLLEAIDMAREAKQEAKKPREVDPHLIEAVKRLLA